MDSQWWLKAARWLGIQKAQRAKGKRDLADAKGARYPIRVYSCWKRRWYYV